MIITAGDDAEVRVWDLITKSCVATLKVGPNSTPQCVVEALHVGTTEMSEM